MSKKSSKKTKQTLPVKPDLKPTQTGYPAEQADLQAQELRVKRAAAAGAEALQASPRTAATEPSTTAAAAAAGSPPVTPLAALQSIPSAPRVKSEPPQQASSRMKEPDRAAVPVPMSPPSSPPRPEPSVNPNVNRENLARVTPPPASASPKAVNVTFVLVDLGARQVTLSGDFNCWSPDALPMKRNAAGHWEATLPLAPGRYEYKFVVDGQWTPDPRAKATVWNIHGTLNSVVEVQS